MSRHSNLTYNTTELSNGISYQPDETGVVISQTNAPRIIGTGTDTSRLERWTWTRLQGKIGISWWYQHIVHVIFRRRECRLSMNNRHCHFLYNKKPSNSFIESERKYTYIPRWRWYDNFRNGLEWSRPTTWHKNSLTSWIWKRQFFLAAGKELTGYEYIKGITIPNRWYMVYHKVNGNKSSLLKF